MRTIKTKVFLFYLFSLTSLLFAITPGEKLRFSLQYEFIVAGRATLQVSETTYKSDLTGSEYEVYQIKSTAKTNDFFDVIHKVRDELISTWDKNRQISLKFDKSLREGFYKQRRIHWFYPEMDSTKYQSYSFKQKKFNEPRMFPIEKQTQDILSSFYYTREQDLNKNKELFINITTDKNNYIAKVIVHKKVKIKTIFGKKTECLVIEPILAGDAIFKQTGKILIWVTNDEKKIPVLLKSKFIIGSFKAVLREIEYVEAE